MQIIMLLVITGALPIMWLIAEFKARTSVRRGLGIVTILWSFGIAYIVGHLQKFNANSYFTSATKDFLTSSTEQLKAGRHDAVLREWIKANDQFHVTYENRGDYQQIIDQAIEGMKKP